MSILGEDALSAVAPPFSVPVFTTDSVTPLCGCIAPAVASGWSRSRCPSVVPAGSGLCAGEAVTVITNVNK